MEQQQEESASEEARPEDSHPAGDPGPPIAAGPVPPPSPASTPAPRSPLGRSTQPPISGTPPQPEGASPPLHTRASPPVPPRNRVPPDEPIGSVSDGRTAESDGTRPYSAMAGVAAASQVDHPALAPSEMTILWNQLTVLGAMQILLGLIQLVFGVALSVSMVYSVAGKSGVSFWTGFWFILSGSCTIQLRRQPTRWNVKAGVVTNGVSIAATVIAVIMYSVSLLFMPPPEQVYFSATTFSLSVGLLLFTLMEMSLASIVAFYSYKRLFQFESTYTILHNVITGHPTHSS